MARGRRAAAGVRRGGADRPAVPVLGAHAAGRQARLVRPLVLQPQQPPRAPCRERPLPRPELRRHPDRVGPPVRHLRRGRRRRALRLRHARAAAQLQPAVGQPAGLPRPVAGQLARTRRGPTSCACGSSRRAGGRPTWRRAGPSRPSTSPPCSATTRRWAPGAAAAAACCSWPCSARTSALPVARAPADAVRAAGRPRRRWWPRCGPSARSRSRARRGPTTPGWRPSDERARAGPAGRRLHLRQQGRPRPALHRGARRDAHRGRGRIRLRGRPHRLRQEHAAERGRRAAGAQHRQRAGLRPAAGGHQHARRLHVPGREPDALAHRAGQRDGGAGVPRRGRRRARRPRTGCAASAWAASATATRTSSRAACASAPAWRRRWRWTPTSS